MNTAELTPIILTVGSLLPLLTALLQQPGWSRRTRTIVGVVVAALAGLVTYGTTNGFDLTSPGRAVTCMVGVILASATAYRALWKQTGVTQALETATSPAAAARADADRWPADVADSAAADDQKGTS